MNAYHDILESPEAFGDHDVTAAMLAIVLLLKTKVQLGLDMAQNHKSKNGVDLDEERMSETRTGRFAYVSKEIIETGDIEGNIEELNTHRGGLHALVEDLQPGFWKQLSTANKNLSARRDASGLKRYPILHVYRAYAETVGAFRLVKNLGEKMAKTKAAHGDR